MKISTMALAIASLLCPFTVALVIFMLKKHIAKMHYNNTKFNVLDNAPPTFYQVALVGHWLVMGSKTNNSHVDTWVSKMEAAIENIASLVTIGNLAVNQLMERETAMAIIAKVMFIEEPKWIAVMAKNVWQVVSRLWKFWPTCPNRRSTNSTCASLVSRPRKMKLRRSWCSDSTHSCCSAK